MAVTQTTTESETPWYQSIWSWLGDTAKDVYTAKLQSDTAKYEADALAREQVRSETIDFLGYDLSKQTLLWIAGGSLLAVLVVLVVKK